MTTLNGEKMKGLYIHIPFCKTKCGYCDFYSFKPTDEDMDSYKTAVLSCIEEWKKRINGGFDSIYFGGGTPSFFGGERLSEILDKARECFEISDNTEITVECNPSSVDEALMKTLKKAGVNRISLGVQSALTSERKMLGRASNCEQVKNAIALAKANGIDNISLDLMLGIAGQTMQSLDESIDFLLEQNVKHISAYLLKIEEGTPLFKRIDELTFPDEDEVCEMYLHTVKRLEENGFFQYEISNFAEKGFESRHNTKYWKSEEYLGIGPSAHSFLDGKRFFYKNDFASFLRGEGTVPDGAGGDEEEFVMLALRLSEGLKASEYKEKYKKEIPKRLFEKAKIFEKNGFVKTEKDRISLTPKGFLVSNIIIEELVELL